MTGGELVARTLKGAGVGHVFTLCGGHILPIYDGCLGEAITLVDVRHEQAAAHCADAYARLTRRVGVAVVAPGPGVTDAVTGVANAYAARSPVLLIAGAGGGVYWDDAAESLAAFAERAGAPVFMNGAGRGALPSSHPNAFALARGFALGQADLVLVLGTPLDFRLGYGRPPLFAEGAKVVMIDVDPAELARNRPLELGLAGDLDVILRQLSTVVPATRAERTAPWLTAVRARETESRGRLDGFRPSEQVPVSHYRLAAEIARVVSPETIVVGDGGDIVGCASKVVRLDRPGQWLAPGPLGCLGIGPSDRQSVV